MVRKCDGVGGKCLDGSEGLFTDDWWRADGVTVTELDFWSKLESN
jgi:hypothetical protein